MQHQNIIILDFGSQYTQLIARRIRELNVYCEIIPFYESAAINESTIGVILSGSPSSVNGQKAPVPQIDVFNLSVPVLGVCYGAQLMVHQLGGVVSQSEQREYGRSTMNIIENNSLLINIPQKSVVWMSHGDSIKKMPEDLKIIAQTENIPVAAFCHESKDIYGIQFHPEVYHTEYGKEIISNFVYNICRGQGDWSPANFIEESVEKIRQKIGNDKVILGLSGGVDSSVVALLLHKAIGNQLIGIFINNGLLRHNEFQEVLQSYEGLGLNVKGVDASEKFYEELAGITEPEHKRKIIGKVFIDVFQEEAKSISNAQWLAQGTIYPDVIESVSVNGPSVTIKSHHNVGGLPDTLHLKLIEPLRNLFKDEVRRVGAELNLPEFILNRHPFPGPGLGIRILGEITEEKVQKLQLADAIFIKALKEKGLYDKIWQAGTIFLPISSVGVMGDERTYENVVALRAVVSTDGMTADWYHLPYDFLADVSNKIINQVKGINRVVYDISSKPPATIEWE